MGIRILHVLDNLGNGGLQNGLANLISLLDPDRYEHVLCPVRLVKPADEQPFPYGRTQVVTVADSGSRFAFSRLAEQIRKIRPDIVHTRNWAAIEAVAAARYVRGCRIVHSEHGVDHDTIHGEPLRRSLFRRLSFELADRVLSVSFQTREFHAKRTGYPLDKITVIHNGVDNRRFRPNAQTRRQVRAELGIGPDEFCFGCVGNLTPVKDHMSILQALEELEETPRQWRLLLVGDGPELPNLKRFSERQPWGDRVLFLGRSSRVAELLTALDAYVLASVTEGINNSMLEAMATGVPIITTETGGNPEVVTHDQSGLLFLPGDVRRLTSHLRAVLKDDQLRGRLSQGALERVQSEFSLPSMVRKYEAVYDSLTTASATAQLTALGA